jgi:hypothetical protein
VGGLLVQLGCLFSGLQCKCWAVTPVAPAGPAHTAPAAATATARVTMLEPGVCPHMPPPCLPALPCLPAGAADPESQAVAAKLGGGYEWRADDAPTFFPGRHASVYFKGQRVGEFGIIHPEVLAAFDIVNPGGCHGRLGLGVAWRSAGVRAWLLFSSRPAG